MKSCCSQFSLSVTIIALRLLSVEGCYNVDPNFKIDVHSHAVPDNWRQALIEYGYPVENGTLYTDGFPVPDWSLSGHIAAMDSFDVNYSTISVSAPGVNLASSSGKAHALAHSINQQMQNWTLTYPKRLGAMCILPLPHIKEAVEEVKYCLDVLHFDGIGMYTNANGLYLGDAELNPVFDAISERNGTIFVHPAAPSCSGVSMGYPGPMTEYPFDSVRAMENLLLTGQRKNFSDINIIFPHGGGAIPYLATRIAGMASLSFLGGLNVTETLMQFKSYFFDTASATSAIQLLAMADFGGVARIVTGTDYPYVPTTQASAGLEAIQSNGDFNASEMV